MPSVMLFCKVANGMGLKVEDAWHHNPNAHFIRGHFLPAKIFTNPTSNALKQKIFADHQFVSIKYHLLQQQLLYLKDLIVNNSMITLMVIIVK